MKRSIDSVFNHLSQACFNLESHVHHMAAVGAAAANEAEQKRILETIGRLRKMLDLAEPCTIVIRCPTGETAFKPMEGVEILPFDTRIEGTVVMSDELTEQRKTAPKSN